MINIKDVVNTIICGHTIDVLKTFPDECIDMVLTSPPYWSLRNYKIEPTIWGGDANCEHIWISEITKKPNMGGGHTDFVKSKGQENYRENVDYHNRVIQSDFCQKCGAWRGQLGLEPNPEMFIENLVSIFDEIKRVLKKTGTIFVNISDTYWGGQGEKQRQDKQNSGGKSGVHCLRGKGIWDYQSKCLCMIPERFCIQMIKHDWILRNKIIWAKPNPMPSSVKDRFSNTWEYVYFFSKSKKYFFDLDAIRIPMAGLPDKNNPKGKNPGDVWKIPSQSFKGAHFATFPEKLCITPIKAGCPEFTCKKCGKIREKILKPTERYKKYLDNIKGLPSGNLTEGYCFYKSKTKSTTADYRVVGYTDCNCPEPKEYKPGIVLDPFCGSGTACMVAKKLGRYYIGIDLKPEYCEMARQRILKECGGLF